MNLYHTIIHSFSNKNILVIGDLILDVYLKGVSTRLSPEAPVPVVDVLEKIPVPGGAANTVCNLASLGANVTYCCVIGNDSEGDLALRLLNSYQNVNTDFIIRTMDRETITKTRVVAASHVITRLDQGTTTAVEASITDMLVDCISRHYQDYDAIIISDYDKGLINTELVDALNFLQEKHHKPIFIDSKRLSFFRKLKPEVVKPNYEEAVKLMNTSFQSADRVNQLQQTADKLLDVTGAQIVVVTLDAEGCLVFESFAEPIHIHAPAVSHPHVSGAGDTFMSAYALSYVSGATAKESAELATAAAGIAVEKEMTTTCTKNELINHFNSKAKYIFTLDELRQLSESYRAAGKKIVFTNGCFDILHSGHVAYLHCAKELGDVLIVGVNNDESIKRLKGEARPINPLVDRLQVLAGLSAVDHVIPFGPVNDDTPISLIEAVRPHIFAKGGDYTKDKLPEATAVEKCGGEIILLPHIPEHSTTEIINRISKTTIAESLQMETSA